MKVAAVVPIKALGEAKTRLSEQLDARERGTLALWLLGRVTYAITSSGVVVRTAIVSPDRTVQDWARRAGMTALRQDAGDLNAALALGSQWACDVDAAALLVVLGDLPLLTEGDVRSLVARGADLRHQRTSAGIAVLAPDRAGTGTNALLVSPPQALPFAFGEASRAQHVALARQHDVALATYASFGTAFDVDEPADLETMRHLVRWSPAPGRAVGAPATRRCDERTA